MRATAITKRPFTVSEYHRMAEAGILRQDDRTELIDGEIYRIGGRSARRTPPAWIASTAS